LLYDILFNDPPKHKYHRLKVRGHVRASEVDWLVLLTLYQYILLKKKFVVEHNAEVSHCTGTGIYLIQFWKKPFMNHLQVIAVLQMQQRNKVPLSVLHELLLR
jgi:hypothetical protein